MGWRVPPFGMWKSKRYIWILLTSSCPTNRMQVGSIGVLGRPLQSNGRPKDVVWNGKRINLQSTLKLKSSTLYRELRITVACIHCRWCAHQWDSHVPQLLAQLLYELLNCLCLLSSYIVIITENDVRVNARKSKQIAHCLQYSTIFNSCVLATNSS